MAPSWDLGGRQAFEVIALAALLVIAGLAAAAGLEHAFGPAGALLGAAIPPALVVTWRARFSAG